MTGNDEVDDNPSPWASDVSPPVAAPIEFVFTTSSNDDAALPGSDGHRESSNAAIERPPRRWRAIVAAAVAVAVAGIAGAVWLGSNSQGDDTPPDSVSVDIDDLPALPSVDGATDGVATVTPTTSLPIAFPDPFEDFNDFNDGNLDLDPEYSATVAWWTSGTVDVPEPLNTTASMTLVVRTERNLTEVDLPSGTTRSFALLRGSSFDEIVVGRTATFVPGEGSPGSGADPPWLLIPGEPPALIEAGNDSLTVWDRPGTDRFSAVAFDFALEAAVSLDVGLDGSSTSTPLDLDDGQALASLGSFAPNGNDLFVDGGGIYERTSDGVTIRIAQGELLASSSHHILIRSCDDNYLCSGQLIDYRDGARSEVQLDPSYASAFSGAPAQISPDGRYLLAPGATFRGTATLLDLQTGEIQDLNDVEFEPTETTATNHVWAADSSGYFRLSGQQVEFYDVSSGQSTLLPQLGDVASYGVRLDLTGVPEPPSIEEARTGLRVRGADRVGTMYDLDLDTGEVTTYEAPEDTTLHYAPRLIIGVGSEPTLLASERGPGTLQLIDGATSSIRLDIDLTSAVLPGPAGSGWRQWGDDGRVFLQFDTTGADLPATIRVPVGLTVIGGDGAGNLLAVAADQSVTILAPSSAEFLTDAELLGIGSTSAIVRSCDSTDCTTSSINRATGARTTLTAPASLASQQAIGRGTGLMVENNVSPDGTVLFSPTDNGPWRISDLSSDLAPAIDIASAKTGVEIVWSEDSQFALFLSSEALWLYDRQSATVTTLRNAPPLTTLAAL